MQAAMWCIYVFLETLLSLWTPNLSVNAFTESLVVDGLSEGMHVILALNQSACCAGILQAFRITAAVHGDQPPSRCTG